MSMLSRANAKKRSDRMTRLNKDEPGCIAYVAVAAPAQSSTMLILAWGTEAAKLGLDSLGFLQGQAVGVMGWAMQQKRQTTSILVWVVHIVS